MKGVVVDLLSLPPLSFPTFPPYSYLFLNSTHVTCHMWHRIYDKNSFSQMSVETDFLPTSSDLPNHVMAMFWTEISFFTSENLKIRCNIVHQTRWGSQIIPQKYYKNQIELDHNFVLYEPFQILTQQNKEGQIYRFVENPEIE